MSCLTALWHWLANPPTTTFHDALIAIASVSAVLWTGGLIVRQLTNYMDVQFRAGIEYMGFAFFAPMFALFITGSTLRITAGAFLVFYLIQTYKNFQYTKDVQVGKIPPPATVAPAFVPQWKKNAWAYLWLSLVSDFAILVIVVLPFDQAIAWTSVLLVLLCQKLRGNKKTFGGGRAHVGQLGNSGTRAAIKRERIVAMELGICLTMRGRRASRLEIVG